MECSSACSCWRVSSEDKKVVGILSRYPCLVGLADSEAITALWSELATKRV